jgi:hypothetical protein
MVSLSIGMRVWPSLLGRKSLDIETRLQEIIDLDRALFQHFQDKFSYPEELSRSLVSFQSNKAKPIYRWYKYKEALALLGLW